MKHKVKKMAFGGVSMSRLQDLSKGSPAQAAVKKPLTSKQAIAKVQESMGRATDPDVKAALQRQIQRISDRASSAAKATRPMETPPNTRAPAQAPGDRVTTMPVGKPTPVDLKPPTPAPATGDRVTTLPVGKPIMANPGVSSPADNPMFNQRPGSAPTNQQPRSLPPGAIIGQRLGTNSPSPTPTGGGARPQMIAKGGKAKEKKYASGGMTASKRADGVAQRGKTKCKMY